MKKVEKEKEDNYDKQIKSNTKKKTELKETKVETDHSDTFLTKRTNKIVKICLK